MEGVRSPQQWSPVIHTLREIWSSNSESSLEVPRELPIQNSTDTWYGVEMSLGKSSRKSLVI